MRKAMALLILLLFLPVGIGYAFASDFEPDILLLQQRLLALDYSLGQADGIAGNRTLSAIRTAQTLLRDAGFPVEVTGFPDEYTYTLIMDESNDDLLRTLIPGSSGDRVRAIQTRLNEINLLRGGTDGIWGQDTGAALAVFEASAYASGLDGIVVDGCITPIEYDVLMGPSERFGIISPESYDPARPEDLVPEHLYAAHAIVIDGYSGKVLLAKDPDTPAEPASTTKILTLITALSLADPDQTVTIPSCALDVPKDSSLVPVLPGEQMTLRDLLYALMIRSGNDAANAVAEICSGSIDAFVQQMNATASRLGMTSSSFVNPHGYHAEGHLSTARDLVTAARYGLTLPEFWSIALCRKYTLPATNRRDALEISLNYELFDPASDYWIPSAFGIKSGYTSKAGFCYVGACQKDGVTLIAAVMGGRTRNQAWADLKKLFSYGSEAMSAESKQP